MLRIKFAKILCHSRTRKALDRKGRPDKCHLDVRQILDMLRINIGMSKGNKNRQQ